MSSFVLDSISDAIEAEDDELLEKLQRYKERQYDNLIQKQSDLVYYGGFSYEDVERMNTIEVEMFLNIVRKREESKPDLSGLYALLGLRGG